MVLVSWWSMFLELERNKAPEHALRFPQRVAQLLLEATDAQFRTVVTCCDWALKAFEIWLVCTLFNCLNRFRMIWRATEKWCAMFVDLILNRFYSLTGICGLLNCFSSYTGHFLCWVWTAEKVFYRRSLIMILFWYVLKKHRIVDTPWILMAELDMGIIVHVLSCFVSFVHPCSRSRQCWLCFSAVVQVLPSSWHLKGNTMTSKRQAFEEHRRTSKNIILYQILLLGTESSEWSFAWCERIHLLTSTSSTVTELEAQAELPWEKGRRKGRQRRQGRQRTGEHSSEEQVEYFLLKLHYAILLGTALKTWHHISSN